MRSNDAIPLSLQATASPSMMQERERSRESASTISGKRRVKSLPGRLYSRTRSPFLRAMMRKPSCLISCSHRPPEGSLSVLVGRHGAMKPVARGRNDMADKWRTCAEESSQTITSPAGDEAAGYVRRTGRASREHHEHTRDEGISRQG